MEERRLAHRYKLPLPTIVKRLPPEAAPPALHVTTRDVSTSGVYFSTDQPLSVGAKLDLALTLPSEITLGSAVVIDAQARVTRVDQPSPDERGRYGIAVAIDRFNVSRAAVDFALHKAEQIAEIRRPAAAAG
jgi:hypothetical protein